jgi:hypothetical protein
MNKAEFHKYVDNLHTTDSKNLNKSLSKEIEDLQRKNRIMREQIKEIITALKFIIKENKPKKKCKIDEPVINLILRCLEK